MLASNTVTVTVTTTAAPDTASNCALLKSTVIDSSSIVVVSCAIYAVLMLTHSALGQEAESEFAPPQEALAPP